MCRYLRGSHTRFGGTNRCRPTGKEERQGTTGVWGAGVSPPPGSTPGAVSGDLQNEDNVTPTATGTAAASSSRDKCGGLEWDSSSGDDGTYQAARRRSVHPWVSNTPALPPPPDRSCTPTPPVCLHLGIKSPVASDADDGLAGFCSSGLLHEPTGARSLLPLQRSLTPAAFKSPHLRPGKRRSRRTPAQDANRSLTTLFQHHVTFCSQRCVVVVGVCQTSYKSRRETLVWRKVLTRALWQVTLTGRTRARRSRSLAHTSTLRGHLRAWSSLGKFRRPPDQSCSFFTVANVHINNELAKKAIRVHCVVAPRPRSVPQARCGGADPRLHQRCRTRTSLSWCR